MADLMRVSRMLAGVAAVALLGACATQPMPVAEASAVPAERVLWAQPGDAGIVVVRDRGFLGSACHVLFSVNGQPAARVAAGERVDLRVPSGELRLSVAYDGQKDVLCTIGRADYVMTREFSIARAQTKGFRIHWAGDGGLDVLRAD